MDDHVFFGTRDVTCTIEVRDEAEMAIPGDRVRRGVRLGRPVARRDGDRFAIREGVRTVDSGLVSKVVAKTS